MKIKHTAIFKSNGNVITSISGVYNDIHGVKLVKFLTGMYDISNEAIIIKILEFYTKHTKTAKVHPMFEKVKGEYVYTFTVVENQLFVNVSYNKIVFSGAVDKYLVRKETAA